MKIPHAPSVQDSRQHRRPLRAGLIAPLAGAMILALLTACSTVGLPSAGGTAQANAFVLRSPAVADGGTLPVEFTGDGAGLSPPLAWSGAPEGTRSYALIMHHTDVEEVTYSYWILYNIPAGAQGLPKDVKGVGTLGLSSRGNHVGYTPPHSAGPGMKTYTLTLYALSAAPRVMTLPSEVSREALLAAMKDLTLGSASLRVTYTPGTAPAKPDGGVSRIESTMGR